MRGGKKRLGKNLCESWLSEGRLSGEYKKILSDSVL